MNKTKSYNDIYFDSVFLKDIISRFVLHVDENKFKKIYSIIINDWEFNHQVNNEEWFFKEYKFKKFIRWDLRIWDFMNYIFLEFDNNWYFIITIESDNEFTIRELFKMLDDYYKENRNEKKVEKEIYNKNVTDYISINRINEIKELDNSNYDLSVLIQFCEEINICHNHWLKFSVILLVRWLINHVPPIFDKETFKILTAEWKKGSIKDSLEHLEKSSRKIADRITHEVIAEKMILPTDTQINYSNDLDVLLWEICRKLK